MWNDRNREAWFAFEDAYWTALEARLGSSGCSGPQRRYGDVEVLVDATNDEGEIQFIVAEGSPGLPGQPVPHFSFSEAWPGIDAEHVAQRTFNLVERMRADPLHQVIHGTRR